MRDLISTCLKGEALCWHSSELTELERDYFREVSNERWCANLIKQFKERSPTALKKLHTESYTYADTCRGRKPRASMQDILRHAKAADYPSVYHQCTTAWNNLELDFRAQIPEPAENITLASFPSQLDTKESIWKDQAARQRNTDGNISSNFGSGPAYVQRQIDRLLRPYRAFAKAYVDDIVIHSKTLEEHLVHLRQMFEMLRANNIFVKPEKALVGYPSVHLLGQKADSQSLATAE